MKLIAGIRSLLSLMAARRRQERARVAAVAADIGYWRKGGAA